MAKIISIHSFRGGTGKSNTTANLAVMLTRLGKRVGVVDTDIQSPGIHVLFQLDDRRVKYTLNDYLWGTCPIEECAYDVTATALGDAADPSSATWTDAMRLYLVPASIKSNEIGRILKEGFDVGLLNDGFKQLIQKLKLDYLLVDTHPGVNEETLLSIAISDALVLVMRPDNQDFQGTAVTLELARRLEMDNVLLLVNKVPPGLDRDALRRKVETLFQVPVIAMLPLNHEIVRVASAGIFINRYPEHPLTLELELLARRVSSL